LHNISVSYCIANSALRRFQRLHERAHRQRFSVRLPPDNRIEKALTEASCLSAELPGGGAVLPHANLSRMTKQPRTGHSCPHCHPPRCGTRRKPTWFSQRSCWPRQGPPCPSYRSPGWASQVCQNPRDEFWHSSWRDSGSTHAARACRKEIHRAAGHESFDSAWPDGMAAPSLGRE